MPQSVPDLWRRKEDATRLYQLYLCRLQLNHLHERAISACRQIRRHASRGPGASEGLFTFSFEIDSLCDLQNYEAAWRQLRRRDGIILGERLDLARRDWSVSDGWGLASYYAPLLFFRGRYQLGCKLLETWLGFWFKGKAIRSSDILFHVYNGHAEPRNRCHVTLAHFYDRLGKRLRDWEHWEAFVNGFHPRLFGLAGIRREDLLVDSGNLAAFFDRLRSLRKERTTSGVGGSQSDLLDSAAKVRKRQQATQRRLDDFKGRIRPTKDRTNRKLVQLFPELRSL